MKGSFSHISGIRQTTFGVIPSFLIKRPKTGVASSPAFSTLAITRPIQGPDVVLAIQVKVAPGEMRFVPEDEVLEGLDKYFFIANINDSPTVISADFYEEHFQDIFDYKIEEGLSLMEANSDDPVAMQKHREVFLAAKNLAFSDRHSIGNINHYAFMINEAAACKGDYILAAAIMLHNLDDKLASRLTGSVLNQQRDVAAEVLRIRERFLRAERVPYNPPPGILNFLIQNHMDSMICILQGDPRAFVMFLVQKLSDIVVMQEISTEEIKSVKEIYAPLAERFGLYDLAVKMGNMAFRIESEDVYDETERDILISLDFETREAAMAYLSEISTHLASAVEIDGKQVVSVNYRVKTPWSAYTKKQYKSDEYPEIEYMQDLMGIRCITKERLTAEEALEYAKVAMGNKFGDFNYTNRQTETKRIGPKGAESYYQHVSVISEQGRAIEIQFICEEDYKEMTFGKRAHWAYKLEKMTKQKFDDEVGAYGAVMTGDPFSDFRKVYEYLSEKWVYVFAESSRGPRWMRVIRKPKGSVPVDIACWILREGLSSYAGVMCQKVWDRRLPQKKSEQKELETGDYVEVIVSPSPTFSNKGFSGLISIAKGLATKIVLTILSEKNSDNVVWLKTLESRGLAFLRKALKERKAEFSERDMERIFIKAARKMEVEPNTLLMGLGFNKKEIVDVSAVAELMMRMLEAEMVGVR